ncbi:MAG: patatin-like phospholipase family protein [Proteobacteria bacterium]|nr:patatin-like phospholipase family protein [Pseudomonadota bacterium]
MVSNQTTRKPKVALVVGSGGIKTLGVISLFELLNEHHIKPDIIYGTSGGTILSSLWASGYTIAQMDIFIQDYITLLKKHPLSKQIDYRTMLSLAGYPGGRFKADSAVLKKEWLLHFFSEKTGSKKIEDCEIKLKLLCTELETGLPYLIDKGLIGESVYASCALYPILPPIFLNNKWLVDGVYYSSIPVLQAVKEGYDNIIVLSFEEKSATNYGSFFEFYIDFVSKMFINKAKKQNSLAIDIHHGEVKFINFYYDKAINFWDVDEIDYIRKLSQEVVHNHKDEILNFMKPL